MKRVIGLLGLMMFSGCMCAAPTHGTKTGVIVKIADEGWIPTHEAQMIRGGLSGGSGAMGAAFDFNIKSGPVLDEARKALDTGAEVEVEYDRPVLSTAWDRERSNDPVAVKITIRGAQEKK